MPPANAKPTAITLSDVSKRFSNGVLALEGFSLSLQQGAFTCLVGPSGCGKSTVLRMIAGLNGVTTGYLQRTSRAESKPDEHEVGFVFQEPTLMPWLRVWENVFLPLRLKGLSRKEATERVDGALSMVGLEDFSRAYPRQLSGGMKMRVSIARALVSKPDVLLMDEPFAALDELTRSRLNDDLLRLWRKHQWTVVFVTHSVYESVYLADRVAVMSGRPGTIVADVEITEPRPRDESFRHTPLFGQLCGEVSRHLAATEERAKVS